MSRLVAWAASGNYRSVVVTVFGGRVIVLAAQLGREVARAEGPVGELERVADDAALGLTA